MTADDKENDERGEATVERRPVDPLAGGLTPGRIGPGSNTGMVSQGDMDTGEPDDDELRRQRRDNINPSRPVLPDKPV
ncbi:MAG TPA: hypothetical protein VGD08_08135 [Stellaceae bacterium]